MKYSPTLLAMKRQQLVIFVLISMIPFLRLSLTTAADDQLTLTPREGWSTLFGDKEVNLRFVVKSPKALKGRAIWAFTANNRTIARGEVKLAEADKPANIDIRLPVPPVKDGVVFGAQLSVAVFLEGQEKAELSFEKPLWIYPEDPFSDRSVWLKDLKITLFDPEKKTAEALKKLSVPFEETLNVASLAEIKEGVLIIGEGVAFTEYQDLPEAMIQASGRGLPVLCLAPAKGRLALPGADNPKLPAAGRLILRRQDIITELDKHLDALAWQGEGKVVASSIVIKAEEGSVVGEVMKGAGGWPWLEADFPEKKGKLLVCGFGIIEHWEAGPTPRFLFARLLEHLTPKTGEKPVKEKEKEK